MAIVHRQTGGGVWEWGSLDVQEYTSNRATKQVLIGRSEGASNFEVRHFTIPARGFSSLDEHVHDHGVVVTHGRARLVSGGETFEVSQGDAVYIPGSECHQFENLLDVPFAFLCVIPPKPVSPGP
jgi:quercetin dioxygenase-like cupin family protein